MDRITRLLAVTACTGVALAAVNAAAGNEVTVVRAGSVLDAKKVVRDKETGKLRAPTDEELAEMNAAPSAGFAPNVVMQSRPMTTIVTRPDGSGTIRRSPDDLDALVVSRGADGKVVVRHKGNSTPSTQTQPKE